MKKFFVLSLMIIIAAFLQSSPCKAKQDYYEDTVWVKKTDQLESFYQVKFSNNDSIIVGHSFGVDIFYETETGKEIKGISGNKEVFFINNDENFIRLNQERTVFEIYNTKTFQVIDSLESDGTLINEYAKYDVSKDEKYLIAPIHKGFKIWDIQSKKILKTKIFPDEEKLIELKINIPNFICGNKKIIALVSKVYDDVYEPTTIGYFAVWDFETLDSVDVYPNARWFRLSNNCKYIAYCVGNSELGVEIYELETKKLIQKLPIDGNSLTGIEFSPDDKYVVTSNGPDGNSLIISEVETGKEIHRYWPSSYDCIDVSNNSKFVLGAIGRYIRLFKARYEIVSVPEKNEILKTIYPNPATNTAIIEFEQKASANTKIELINTNGEIIKSVFNCFLESGEHTFHINTSDITTGSYFIVVQSQKEKIVFQLIIIH